MTAPVDSRPRPVIAMLLFPGHTNIDVVGPHSVLAFDADVHLVWKTTDPVIGDMGMPLHPTTTFADCPSEVDAVIIPGGAATGDVIANPDVLQWVADLGQRARFVCAFCTGSLVLAAAGLLDGYRAATHWTSRELLAAFGVENVNRRVVIDGNRITGGGATAGMDFSLTLLAELLGEDRAKFAQLMIEYDPEPPFDSGVPERAPQTIVDEIRAFVTEPNSVIAEMAAHPR